MPFACAKSSASATWDDDVRDLVEGKRAALRENFFEVVALDVLHGDERRAGGVVLPDVVHRDDGGMVEDARGLRFADEAQLELLRFIVVRVCRGADRFQRDQATDQRIFRQIDDAHRALAELAHDFVPTQFQEGLVSGGRGRPMNRQ